MKSTHRYKYLSNSSYNGVHWFGARKRRLGAFKSIEDLAEHIKGCKNPVNWENLPNLPESPVSWPIDLS